MTQEDAIPNIDINPNDWVEIRRILRTCVPEYEVWAFGSRAKWTAKPYSDLDLAIRTDKPLSLEKAAELRSALDDSTIPIKVDFVDWAATSESFRKIIEADKVVVLRPATGLLGWTFKRLIDCTVDGVLSYGIVQPGQHDERGVPIVRVNNISMGQLHTEDPLRVAPDIEANYQRTRLKGGEVLLTVVGTTGQSAIVPKELAGWNVARAVAVIRPKPEIGARWIHICLQSKAVQQFLDERANTTVQKTLNLSDIREVLIPIPPPSVKEVIESIAIGLDDKIELNRRLNATLEAIARALFQSWFVDFDPVRARLDGRFPIGIDPVTANQFPDSFQCSELGQIPKGWDVKTADEVSTVGIGKTPPRKEHQWFSENPADVPWMSIRDLGTGGVFISKTSEFLTRGAVEKFRVKRIPSDTVVLSFKLTIGRVAITDGEMLSNEAIAHFVIKPDTSFGPLYLYCYLKGFGYDQLGSTSSIATAINSEMVRGIRILVPPREISEAFERIVNPLFWKMRMLQRQSRSLSTLRSALLPKLLGGDRRVDALSVLMRASV